MVPKLVCLRSAADTNRSGRRFGRTMREFADVSIPPVTCTFG
jgi:hypothetical protein